MDRRDKKERLCSFLEEFYEKGGKRDKVLIFCETKKEVNFLDSLLHRRGFRVNAIHGDKTQRMRDETLRDVR